ncbi:MAG TPA: hypothetical protein VHZ26_03520 [Caulobacteraceae bacterium]|jgi:hypothetical protein|nr:hypothetical protein [Caulobacteraceae bacterium]
MRIFMRVEIPVEAGNAAIASGALGKVVQAFSDKFKPEALFFAAGDGMRTMYSVFDMAEANDIPSVAEPFFTELKARIEWQPCMDLADLQAGLAKL